MSAGEGDVLPARAADSVVPDPGGAIDVTAEPPPGALPTRALTSMNGPVLVPVAADRAASADCAAADPDVPTASRLVPADCRLQ